MPVVYVDSRTYDGIVADQAADAARAAELAAWLANPDLVIVYINDPEPPPGP